VATCITRKRIAFRQFKAWYWQCFDTNVQARSNWIKGRMQLHVCIQP